MAQFALCRGEAVPVRGWRNFYDQEGGGLLTFDGGRLVEQFHYARPGQPNFWASDLFGVNVNGLGVGVREASV